MICGIYKIENLINHKVYIGQSSNIERRWSKHKSVQEKHSIHLAFDKYGIENFSFEVIEECPIEKLDEREIYWIDKYDSYNNGYNETLGGSGGNRPIKLTPQQVEEITELLKTNQYNNIDIAKMYDVSENTISGINTGYYWKRDNISYPVKKSAIVHTDKKDIIKNLIPEENFCIDCGKRIQRCSTRCTECDKKNRRKVDRPTKEELFNFLTDIKGNFTKAGEYYGVTDNAIRKWCKSYGIPSKSGDYKEPKTEKEVTPQTQFIIQQIDPKTKEILATYNSIGEAFKVTGIYHISEASDENKSRKIAGGYEWRRVAEIPRIYN